MATEYTERGFGKYGGFIDTYQTEVRVQESSAASEDRVWIFLKPHEAYGVENALHLNVDQAKQLRKALKEWIKDVS